MSAGSEAFLEHGSVKVQVQAWLATGVFNIPIISSILILHKDCYTFRKSSSKRRVWNHLGEFRAFGSWPSKIEPKIE